MASSRIFNIAIETSSHPCALLESRLRINSKIFLGLTSISSRMRLVLGDNGGSTASFSRREHCLTKKSLKIIVFVWTFVTKISFSRSGGMFVNFFLFRSLLMDCQ